MRTLTQRELNRALLARQLLLERAELPLPEALERVCGIQAQYAPSMYFGLWSRVRGFEPGALSAALHAREVVQATLMRVTIHLVSPRDFWPFALAVREARRTLWLRAWKEPGAEAMEQAAQRLSAALDGGALTRKEVEALIGKPATRGIHLWLDLVRVPPSGTWERRRADLFGAAVDWIGEQRPDAPLDHLVRRYLAAFGPAGRKDVASFTGVSLTELEPVIERVATERFRPLIFHTKNPRSSPTFLLDGEVAGTWRLDADGFRAEPFERVPAAAMRAVHEEGERLAAAFS